MQPVQPPQVPGPRNALTDVAGLLVGHASRTTGGALTGTTVVLGPPGGFVAAVDVRGGGPGTRETDALDPRNLVPRVEAVVLTGGSAYGLAAADGVMAWLEERGRGFPVGTGPGEVVPVVPAAAVFDLGRGGDFRARPDAALGRAAVENAAAGGEAYDEGNPGTNPAPRTGANPATGTGTNPATGTGANPAAHTDGNTAANAGTPRTPGTPGPTGTPASSDNPDNPAATPATPGAVARGCVGAGTGAVAGGLKGGVGQASVVLPGGVVVAALAVVNAAGSPIDPATGLPLAAGLELAGEFGLRRPPAGELAAALERLAEPVRPPLNTTIGVVATNAALTKAQAWKVAGVAHDGLARAVRPVHTLYDGDTVFAISTGEVALPAVARETPYGVDAEAAALTAIHGAAADVFARAVVHGLLAATSTSAVPAYRDLFPGAVAHRHPNR